MADSDNTKLSVEEQVARIKAAKEAAKKAAKEAAKKAAADKAAQLAAAPPPVPIAPPAPVAKPAPVAPPSPRPAASITPPVPAAGTLPGTELEPHNPAALTDPNQPVPKPATAPVAAAPAAAAPAPGSVEEKVAQIKAAKAAAAALTAAKAAGGTGVVPPAPAAAAPAPGSVEEKVAQIKAAKAAAAAKNATPAAAFAGVVSATASTGPKAVEPGTPEAIARAAAAHAKALGATGIDAKGTPVNKSAVEHLAGAKPGAAKAVVAPKKKEPEGPLPPPPSIVTPRRGFLGFITLGTFTWLVFFTWLAGIGHMFLRFMFPNVLYEPDPKFNAGRKNDYPEAPKVYERFKQDQAVWIVRLTEDGQDRLVALSTVCTHLGCTPNWLETEKKYKCPCHGSGYYIDGVNFEGPTPRPLERFRIFVDGTGNVIVDKAKKYRKDLDQWNENQSFIAMG